MVTITSISKEALKRAKPVILAVCSLVFNTAAIGTTIKATIYSTKRIEEKRQEGPLNTKDIIKEIAPKFILPASLYLAGQASVIGSALLSNNQSIALSGAALAANYRFDQYRKEVVEQFGEEADSRITRSFKDVPKAKKQLYTYAMTPYGGPGEAVIADMPEGENILFDVYRVGESREDGTIDDGYFAINKDEFLQARHMFCDYYFMEGHVTLNHLYDFFGIERTYGGYILGYDMSDGPERIEIGLVPKDYDPQGTILSYEIKYYWSPVDWPLEE